LLYNYNNIKNLSHFAILYKNINKMKFKNTVLSWQHLKSQRDPAFSVGQLPKLHVKSMFGKYRPARPYMHALLHACISSSTVSSAIWKTAYTSENFKDNQNCTCPKHENIYGSSKNSQVHIFSNCTRNHNHCLSICMELVSDLLL
jgi:hypothetical protein